VILYIIPLAAAATALGRRATSTPRLASSIVANLDSKGLQKIKNKYSVHVQGWQHTSESSNEFAFDSCTSNMC
jgi:hypothetical protein